ncbi:MAG: NADH:flavin oxidoreductase [Proteobacteria bacterium]|nr:NADH:flavin oxidoreductase [Pseudomonadota bacterium]
MAERAGRLAFQPGHIGNLEIKNRLVRSATYENAATHSGYVTDALIDLYKQLAGGGAGLIVTGIAGVYPEALAPHLMMRADADDFIPGLRSLTRAVHALDNGCRIMLQLHHPGRQIMAPEASPPPMPPALWAYLERSGYVPPPPTGPLPEPTAPSAIFDATFNRTPRALEVEEIEAIIAAYAQGIRRAREAGFDGVQLHAAHGWLLSAFMSPHTNRRDDNYGGSTGNRVRIVREICTRGHQEAGIDFPILIKMNTTDFFEDGTDLEESARVGKLLAETGFAALETSGGMWESTTRSEDELGWPPVLLPESRTGIKTREQEAYFLPGAEAVKKAVDVPVILVGGIRSASRIEEILASGAADFVALSRPLIRQPDLPNRWLSGDGPDKAACISCNACLPLGDLPTGCKAVKK